MPGSQVVVAGGQIAQRRLQILLLTLSGGERGVHLLAPRGGFEADGAQQRHALVLQGFGLLSAASVFAVEALERGVEASARSGMLAGLLGDLREAATLGDEIVLERSLPGFKARLRLGVGVGVVVVGVLKAATERTRALRGEASAVFDERTGQPNVHQVLVDSLKGELGLLLLDLQCGDPGVDPGEVSGDL